ncbi:MAG: DUF3857 domain-containing protein [Bacteroidota bacterium]
MKFRHLIIILFTVFYSQFVLAQNYIFEKTPEWVKRIEIPDSSDVSVYDVLSGYYLTLMDYQVNLDNEEVYNHTIINVVSYSGITEASQLSVPYDTSYQELKIHHLFIWRKGKKIDRTKDLSFEFINNELNLNDGIYTGQITAYDILNDIRKDDLIDFAYTLKGNNPIFDNEKYVFVPLEMLNPVDLYYVRIIYPVGKEYRYNCFDCDSLFVETFVIDNNNIIEIRNENAKAIVLEDYIPTWSLPFKYFTLSSFDSWVDVNNWAQKVFSLNYDPMLDSVFSEIFTGNEDSDQKINKIINFVQDDIRYMGIESGIGSIKPFPPEQVVVQRFGDCKDKSLLLVSLLNQIGVENAYPVLVNTFMQHNVDKLHISNQVFNHVIVRFDYNDSTYWVDPSISTQGGDFRDMFNIDYGKVLIIGLPEDTLQNMSPQKTKSGAYITDEIVINSFTEPSSLRITSNRYGFEADQRRAILQYYTTKDIADAVTKDLKLIYPVVNRIGELEITDNIETNNFVVVYNYEIDDFWEIKDYKTEFSPNGVRLFRFEPILLYQYLDTKVCDDRKFDFTLNHPTNLHYRVIFHFPESILIQDDIDIFENEAFRYEEKVEQISSNSLQIDYHLTTKKKSIKAENYKDICEQMKSIADELALIIFFVNN